MNITEWIFWISLLGLAFIYVLYGPIIWVINRLRGPKTVHPISKS